MLFPQALLLASVLAYFGTAHSASILFEAGEYENEIEGYIEAADGYTCSYFEKRIGGGGGGPRELVMNCKKVVTIPPKKKKGKPTKKTLTYKCAYRGNPHSCKWYNKKGNQPKFYAAMAQFLEGNKHGACAYNFVIIRTKCPNVRFNKVGDEDDSGEIISIQEVEIGDF